MHPKPTNGSNADYATRVGNAIDALDRRLKGNLLDNGAFQVWQRGTSFASAASAVFTADRWQGYHGATANATFSQQAGQTAQYAARLQRNNGAASVNPVSLFQNMETVNSIPAAGRTVTLKMLARCGANFSQSGSGFNIDFYTGTGTDQTILTGFTGQLLTTVTKSVSTSQAIVEQTFSVPAGTRQIGLSVYFTPTGTAGANDWLEIEEVQLVIGDYAGNFPYRTFAEEEMNCRRFLPAYNANGTTSFIPGAGSGASGTLAVVTVCFAVRARVAPTGITVSAAGHFSVNNGAADSLVSALTFNSAGFDSGTVQATVASGLAASQGVTLKMTNASARLLFTGAEL